MKTELYRVSQVAEASHLDASPWAATVGTRRRRLFASFFCFFFRSRFFLFDRVSIDARRSNQKIFSFKAAASGPHDPHSPRGHLHLIKAIFLCTISVYRVFLTEFFFALRVIGHQVYYTRRNMWSAFAYGRYTAA